MATASRERAFRRARRMSGCSHGSTVICRGGAKPLVVDGLRIGHRHPSEILENGILCRYLESIVQLLGCAAKCLLCTSWNKTVINQSDFLVAVQKGVADAKISIIAVTRCKSVVYGCFLPNGIFHSNSPPGGVADCISVIISYNMLIITMLCYFPLGSIICHSKSVNLNTRPESHIVI